VAAGRGAALAISFGVVPASVEAVTAGALSSGTGATEAEGTGAVGCASSGAALGTVFSPGFPDAGLGPFQMMAPAPPMPPTTTSTLAARTIARRPLWRGASVACVPLHVGAVFAATPSGADGAAPAAASAAGGGGSDDIGIIGGAADTRGASTRAPTTFTTRSTSGSARGGT